MVTRPWTPGKVIAAIIVFAVILGAMYVFLAKMN